MVCRFYLFHVVADEEIDKLLKALNVAKSRGCDSFMQVQQSDNLTIRQVFLGNRFPIH